MVKDLEIKIVPDSIVDGLVGLEWHSNTTKSIGRQQRAVHLVGYLNPLREHCISIVSPGEMEWIYAQTEQHLSQCTALCSQSVTLIILSEGCEANPALLAICGRYDIALVKTVMWVVYPEVCNLFL
ncbi:MAG: hypothetical protein GKR96_14995 [Gammaproteobacteria bacterium]|nr:hypothetical protein [Gammaproteobacteria bacterium]